MIRALTVALAFVTGTLPVAAQDRPVSLDVFVTDRGGAPVGAIRPADLELLVDGVPQTIAAVRPETDAAGAFAILLDEFHIAPGPSTDRVRNAVARFVDALPAGDRVAIVKPLQPLSSIELSTDRVEVRDALASFAGRKGDYTPRTALESQLMSRAPGPAEAERIQVVVSALQALVSQFARLRERGVIVLMSDGFDAQSEAAKAITLRTLRAAGHAGVVIYAMDSRADGEAGTGEGPEAELMRMLAAETGGAAVAAGGDLDAALARMRRDAGTRFVVTWQSSLADGKFHPVELRVKKRDVAVRARPGYWAPFPAQVRHAGLTNPLPFMSVPTRPVRRSALIQPSFAVRRIPDGRARVTFTWTPAREYVATRGLPTPSAIRVSITSPDGTLLYRGTVASVDAAASSSNAAAVFDAAAGRFDVDMSILGPTGSLLDMDARSVPVPDFAGEDVVLLEPEFVRTHSALEFREASANAEAAPSPSREFSRTERLLVRIPAYGPGGSPASVTARLLNRSGQVMTELGRAPGEGGVAQFDLQLAPYAPGEYALEIAAVAGEKRARRLVTFRITY